MQTNSQHTQEDQIDIIQIIFTILSQRILIVSSLIVFTLIGIVYNYYHHDVFQTNATILISEDQSDPSSFINGYIPNSGIVEPQITSMRLSSAAAICISPVSELIIKSQESTS